MSTDKGLAIIREVRAVAAEQPDRVYVKPPGYATCLYVNPRSDDSHELVPGCIMGQALWRLGIIDATLYMDSDNAASIWGLLDHKRIEVSADQMTWLERVQGHQDEGNTWASAVEVGDRLVSTEHADEVGLAVMS